MQSAEKFPDMYQNNSRDGEAPSFVIYNSVASLFVWALGFCKEKSMFLYGAIEAFKIDHAEFAATAEI
jgi:hypothetical protein